MTQAAPATSAVAPSPAVSSSGSTRWALRLVAVTYVVVLVVVPLVVMLGRTFEDGFAAFVASVTAPEAVAAITLSLQVALQAVVINTVFGLAVALLLTRYRFRGRGVLNALIDLPVSVSPVIAGLALILVYGRNGWFGGALETVGIQVIYSVPGIVLATCFVSLPLVVRELVPVLEEIGLEQEQAGRALGANAWQRLWRLTLPSVRWALAYGVVLSLARALGEFGAVRVVAGNVLGSTQTMPLLAAQRYADLDEPGAYAISFVMVAIAVLCIIVVALLRPRDHR
ncbi:sulfate transport system permease protein [Friedmanniella luteola]|uniref:Sulfate transport system permease protein n=1 Tax=Friedmanniella luteola TaxID=546871 RepID=A0A1H1WFK2_9ACTN|nr:sulfate transport system permease protein [Friedmanniella luteola]